MDLSNAFLTEQLIAYIGNKRSLLPFLNGVFHDLSPDPSRAIFLDPFAGSGSVSRLARFMGFSVHANDWEYYSWVINSCHLGIRASELEYMFASSGGLEGLLSELNALPPLTEDQAYIARHYAPRNTASADWRTERLFYTRENAQRIDALRTRIEYLYPGTPAEPRAAREKCALLAPLLYEAATHTNTSGVFKACHKGFGGHGGDALTRILAPIRMRAPVLVDTAAPSSVSCLEAVDFLRGHGGDICYLDPPYAVHQYGSNYFMLNSIALWDKPTVSDERGPDGRFRHKAGIRSDWPRTRSLFCSKQSALAAMRDVVNAADCRWIVVSYSNEGLIPVEELCDLLSATGELRVLSTPYAKYPGGKQSLSRTTRNIELAFVVDRRRPKSKPAAGTPSPALTVALAQLFAGSFDPRRIQSTFVCENGSLVLERGGDPRALLSMRHYWRFTGAPDIAALGADPRAPQLVAELQACTVNDVREEIEVIVEIAAGVQNDRERAQLLREAIRLLNKLAHKKNAAAFADALRALRSCRMPVGASVQFAATLDGLVQKAKRRSAGAPGSPTDKKMPR